MFAASFFQELEKRAGVRRHKKRPDKARRRLMHSLNTNGSMCFAGGGAPPGSKAYGLEKKAKPFLEQDRPPKVKEIYKALKRDHPEMPAGKKARIAIRKARKTPQARKSPKHGGPPYKAPITEPGT